MDRERFWSIVEAANAAAGGDCRRQAALVAQALQALPVDETLAFHQIFGEVRAAAYQVDLWGAASLINDGCSDDGFEDFRGWLIGRGRRVYQAALRDADWLASLLQVPEAGEVRVLLEAPAGGLWTTNADGRAAAVSSEAWTSDRLESSTPASGASPSPDRSSTFCPMSR